MKERGGGNQTDRPRWAGDGLLEIWGGPELLADLERVQLFGTAHESAGCRCSTHPHTHLHLHFFSHWAFFCERGSSRPTTKSPKLPQVPARTGGGQQAGPGREANVGLWENRPTLALPSLVEQQAAGSKQASKPASHPPSARYPPSGPSASSDPPPSRRACCPRLGV